MDKQTLEFVTFCIGRLSSLLQLPQQEIYRRLKSSGILDDYIVPSYDVLHTFSSRYLMEDLTEYMREKGVLEAVADLHCRSDKYLAEEIWKEYQEARAKALKTG